MVLTTPDSRLPTGVVAAALPVLMYVE